MNKGAFGQAVYTRLASFTPVSSVVVGVYHQAPPSDEPESDDAFPFIKIGPNTHSPFDTDDTDGQVVALQVHLWDRYGSEITRGNLTDAIYDALHRYQLPIVGANTVDCYFETLSDFEESDGETHHTILQFRVTYDSI